MSYLYSLQQKSIAILGYGVNNRELTYYLLKNGLSVTILDQNPELPQQFADHLTSFAHQITWEIGPTVFQNLSRFDILFRTPALPVHHPAIQAAVEKGTLLTSQTQLFLELCPALVIGVTGTKGKGTTCSLMYQILSQGYSKGKTYLAGNIGVDPFSFLDDLEEDDLVILELSSFQLEDVRLSPQISVVLHVTADHLDHHRSPEEYARAKMNILAHQRPNDIAIINTEYPDMAPYLQLVQGKLYQYSRHQPRQQSAWAEKLEGKEIVFLQLESAIESFEITSRKLIGEHNLENILPAAIVGAHFHVSPRVMSRAISEFPGLEHRLSLVGEFGGVRFYDDSIATTPEACIVAMEAFAGSRIHIIVGGKDKGHVYEELAHQLVARATTISLLPGNATKKLHKALQRELRRTRADVAVFPHAQTPVMDTIVSGITPHLKKGDVVLLAPAESSDAPFANYKERGDAFRQSVLSRFGQ